MKKWWESMNKIDRCSLMQSLYFDSELGNLNYVAIPSHIRVALMFIWQKKYKDVKHELNF